MSGSLVTLPVRVGVRCAGLALRGTYAVTERAFGLAGAVAGSIIRPDSPDVDLDGAEPEHAPTPPPATATPRPATSDRATREPTTAEPTTSEPTPAEPTTSEVPTAEPATREPDQPAQTTRVPVDAPPAPPLQVPVDAPLPPLDGPAHVSEEVELVEEVAEPGAEDGAGAQVHVTEPWDGYDQMKADDVIDRITGASVAELATVELYELSGRSRQSVIDAVKRELSRSERAT